MMFVRRIARHGFLGSLKLIPVNIRWAWRQFTPSNLAERRRERALDRDLGIETADGLSQGAIEVETQIETSAQLVRYEPVPLKIFDDITACLPGNLSAFTFIDIGSGKGRALILATRRGFAEVIGVELSPTLHRVAVKNLAKVGNSLGANLYTLNLDARLFQFPPAPSVIFLYNPFGESLMREVVGNIERAHASVSHPVFLLYHWPVHREVLHESGRWEEIDHGGWNAEIGYVWRTFKLVQK